MSDGLILDPGEARRRRDIAIAQVDAGADLEWKVAAAWTILHICLTRPFFTPDAIWAAGLPKPREPRALGPTMLRAAKRGLCRKTGKHLKSESPVRHEGDTVEWQSLIYGTNGVTADLWIPSPEPMNEQLELLAVDDH